MAKKYLTFMTKHQYSTMALELAMVRWAALERRAAGRVHDELIFDSSADFDLAQAEADAAAARLQDKWAERLELKLKNNG